MNETEITAYLCNTLAGVDMVVNAGDSFFFYNPDPNVPPDHMFPFVTLVTSDINDRFSNLDRAGVFRLNIGVSKSTFQTLFGVPQHPTGTAEAADATAGDVPDSRCDFTAFEQVMPHPVYGRQYWVCILNPGAETFDTTVRPLIAEAYQMAVSKYEKKAERRA